MAQGVPVVTSVLLDVDTGIDDALALLYAIAHPGLQVRAVTGVAGNVGLEQVMSNTCRVLDVAGATRVPVAAGAAVTLTGQGPRVGHRHGANGLGGAVLPPSPRTVDPAGAVEVLRREIEQAEQAVTLVGLAPQTNLAQLLRRHPHLSDRVSRVVVVGGQLDVTAEPEFNVGHDPEAAAAVLASGVPVTMYPYDVFVQAVAGEKDLTRLGAADGASAQLAARLLATRFGRLIGDAGALVLLTHPDLFTTSRRSLRVGLHGPERGHTLLAPEARAIEVVTGIDGPAAVDAFVATLVARP